MPRTSVGDDDGGVAGVGVHQRELLLVGVYDPARSREQLRQSVALMAASARVGVMKRRSSL